jgi:hypothetical protein
VVKHEGWGQLNGLSIIVFPTLFFFFFLLFDDVSNLATSDDTLIVQLGT